MTKQSAQRIFLAAGLTLALASTVLTGCSKPPPPPPPKPAPAPPPPPPEPVQIQALLTEAKPDARVQFPQERAPVDASLAKAVIAFADGFAKANSSALGASMEATTKQVLDQLSGSGSLEDEMKKAEAVRIVYLAQSNPEETNATAAQVVLAIQDPGSSYVLGWSAAKVNDAWIFTAIPTTGNTRTRASEWDGTDMSAFAPTAVATTAPSAIPGGEETTSAGTDKAGETGKEPEKKPDDGSKTVRTPNGPIKVPGSPGGG